MVMLCTETKAEINAGLVIVTSCRRTRPFTRQDSTTDMVLGLLASRRDYVTSEEHAFDYESVAASGLLWTPLASCKARQPLHWTDVDSGRALTKRANGRSSRFHLMEGYSWFSRVQALACFRKG